MLSAEAERLGPRHTVPLRLVSGHLPLPLGRDLPYLRCQLDGTTSVVRSISRGIADVEFAERNVSPEVEVELKLYVLSISRTAV